MSDQGMISFIEVSTKWIGFRLHFLVSVQRTLQSLLSVFFLLILIKSLPTDLAFLIFIALSTEDCTEKYLLSA